MSTFSDSVAPECVQTVSVRPGQTLFIPAGWICASAVPKQPTILLSGYFLTAEHMATHIKAHRMEGRLNLRQEFRFPYFRQLLWLFVGQVADRLRGSSVHNPVKTADVQAARDACAELLLPSDRHRRGGHEASSWEHDSGSGSTPNPELLDLAVLLKSPARRRSQVTHFGRRTSSRPARASSYYNSSSRIISFYERVCEDLQLERLGRDAPNSHRCLAVYTNILQLAGGSSTPRIFLSPPASPLTVIHPLPAIVSPIPGGTTVPTLTSRNSVSPGPHEQKKKAQRQQPPPPTGPPKQPAVSSISPSCASPVAAHQRPEFGRSSPTVPSVLERAWAQQPSPSLFPTAQFPAGLPMFNPPPEMLLETNPGLQPNPPPTPRNLKTSRHKHSFWSDTISVETEHHQQQSQRHMYEPPEEVEELNSSSHPEGAETTEAGETAVQAAKMVSEIRHFHEQLRVIEETVESNIRCVLNKKKKQKKKSTGMQVSSSNSENGITSPLLMSTRNTAGRTFDFGSGTSAKRGHPEASASSLFFIPVSCPSPPCTHSTHL